MIELTMEFQKLVDKHAEDMRVLHMEQHTEIQKLHMDQNEHLENEMEKLKKILSNAQKLKDENDALKATIASYPVPPWEYSETWPDMVVFPKTTDRADFD